MCALYLGCFAGLVGCGDDAVEPAQNAADVGFDEGDEREVTWSSLSERPCPEESNLTYENFGEPFMLNWCTGCHASNLEAGSRAGATLGIDLDSKDAMQMHADRIWARSGDLNESMPPVGGPDELERWMLAEWLACGAP